MRAYTRVYIVGDRLASPDSRLAGYLCQIRSLNA